MSSCLHGHGLRNLASISFDVPECSVLEKNIAVASRYIVPDLSGLARPNEYLRPMSTERAGLLMTRIQAYLQGRDIYVVDGYAGVSPDLRIPLRLITTSCGLAWSFKQMLDTSQVDRGFVPELSFICAPGFEASPEIEATESTSFTVIFIDRRTILIGGSDSPDEVIRALLTEASLLLLSERVIVMKAEYHADGGTLFVGRGGVIGWGPDGIFDICPVRQRMIAHPKHLVLLASDSSGALPAFARLSAKKAAFFFMCGMPASGIAPCYTSDLALPPGTYAGMLRARLERYGTVCWIANTATLCHEYFIKTAISDGFDVKLFQPDGVLELDIPEGVPITPEASRKELALMLATVYSKLAYGDERERPCASPQLYGASATQAFH